MILVRRVGDDLVYSLPCSTTTLPDDSALLLPVFLFVWVVVLGDGGCHRSFGGIGTRLGRVRLRWPDTRTLRRTANAGALCGAVMRRLAGTWIADATNHGLLLAALPGRLLDGLLWHYRTSTNSRATCTRRPRVVSTISTRRLLDQRQIPARSAYNPLTIRTSAPIWTRLIGSAGAGGMMTPRSSAWACSASIAASGMGVGRSGCRPRKRSTPRSCVIARQDGSVGSNVTN